MAGGAAVVLVQLLDFFVTLSQSDFFDVTGEMAVVRAAAKPGGAPQPP
jgi:hypothetical protein